MPEISRLDTEVKALLATAASASKNPFVPAAARDAINQASSVISLLASEITAMRHAMIVDFQLRAAGGTPFPFVETH